MKRIRNKKGKFIRSLNPYFMWFLIIVVVYAVLVLVGVNFKRSAENLKAIGRETVIHNVSAKSEIKEIQDTKSWINAKIEKVAAKYGRSAYQMKRTVECETRYKNKQSEVVKNGKREDSWGIYQIHLPDHPSVSREQAMDIDFAIDWAGQHWNDVKWYAYNRKTDKCN